MDTLGKLLDLLFRRIPPERILDALDKQASGFDKGMTTEKQYDLFLRFAETTLSGYSEDEHILLYRYFQETSRRLAERSNISQQGSLLLPIVAFALETLTTLEGEPLCRTSQTLRWRSVYHLFGQDMFVCAYFAYTDMIDGGGRNGFGWPATLRTDNTVLNGNLAHGIAENHRHLKGSTQSFDLTWCVLMNKPNQIERLPKEFDAFLQAVTIRGPEDNVLSTKGRLILAALVRTILFRALHRKSFYMANYEEKYAKKHIPFNSGLAFRSEYLNAFLPLKQLSDVISFLQMSCGAQIPLPDGESACLDYALEPEVFRPVENSHYRVMAGERALLYRCFGECFRGNFTDFEQNLFHLYLSLKSSFRSELIQVNRQVGFQNFSNYEKRKDLVWESEPHQWEAYRMAFNAPLRQQFVISLESRITPANTAEANIRKIYHYDVARRFADQPCQPVIDPVKYRFYPELEAERFIEDPSFYVSHFVKRRDDALENRAEGDFRCRHQRLRDEVKTQALALARALSRSAYLCNRIRGIDACSNEVECRPEVFANAFRFLRNFQIDEFADASEMLSHPKKLLSETYHAGEDFYDITDGLRAIDEAVRFLEFRRGDRIGHALAMGIAPEIHYATKFDSIVLPKQNYLDNLVWLLYRGRELNLHIEPQQSETMQQKARQLLREIYGDAMQERGWSISLDEYYCSMLLRGDSPELYQTMSFSPNLFCGEQYERYCLNRDGENLDAYRNDLKIAGLYYYYHYGYRERNKGEKSICVEISPEYISIVRCAQNALQAFLERRGIIIECNPSSNVLIGTFGDYRNHPIFRFNNTGLEVCVEERQANPRLHVCVNTDDLGIFDTSLEFEYALLYQTLIECQNNNGSKKYKSEEIIRYLQRLQEMGLQAVFPAP